MSLLAVCLFFYGDSAVVGGRIVALRNGETREDKFLALCLMLNHKQYIKRQDKSKPMKLNRNICLRNSKIAHFVCHLLLFVRLIDSLHDAFDKNTSH